MTIVPFLSRSVKGAEERCKERISGCKDLTTGYI